MVCFLAVDMFVIEEAHVVCQTPTPDTSYLGVLQSLIGFWPIWENSEICVGILVHEQSSLLDAIFNYILYFGPPGKQL